MLKVFTRGPEDRDSIPTQHYKVLVTGKWSNTGKGVGPNRTLRCSSY